LIISTGENRTAKMLGIGQTGTGVNETTTGAHGEVHAGIAVEYQFSKCYDPEPLPNEPLLTHHTRLLSFTSIGFFFWHSAWAVGPR
jgi:hypothetical protein